MKIVSIFSKILLILNSLVINNDTNDIDNSGGIIFKKFKSSSTL
jgi:hypothetical protein